MDWLSLTILSYLLLAIVSIGDKFIVDSLLRSSKAYAFSVASLGSLVFLVAPWFLEWPGVFLLVINFLSGGFFVFALWLMYEALRRGEASRVVVVIGGIVPVFTLMFSVLFFGDVFSIRQWGGVLLLIGGIFLTSFIVSEKTPNTFYKRLRAVVSGKYKKPWIFLAIGSALFYSLFFLSTKYAYERQEFISSFLWIRLGSFLVALFFLLDPSSRQEIVKSFKAKKKKSVKIGKSFVFINQGAGAIASVVQSYAVYLGPVAIINALQGVQYAFVLIIGVILTYINPRVFKEDVSRPVLFKKIVAVLIISLGLYLII